LVLGAGAAVGTGLAVAGIGAVGVGLAGAGVGAISCGPPAIRPFAMPGPKIDNPSSARDAGISVSASEMVGGSLKPEVK
jgi:hypothetical protein